MKKIFYSIGINPHVIDSSNLFGLISYNLQVPPITNQKLLLEPNNYSAIVEKAHGVTQTKSNIRSPSCKASNHLLKQT